MMPGLYLLPGFKNGGKGKAGGLLWVVLTVVLGRQSFLRVAGSRSVFHSAVLSVRDERVTLFLSKRIAQGGDLQPVNMLMPKEITAHPKLYLQAF